MIKETINIKNIGKLRFWLGVVVWVFSAISLSLFFNYGREILRFFFSYFRNLVMLSEDQERTYNYFFAALSVSLGVNLMLWMWQQKIYFTAKGKRRHARLAQLYAFSIFWMVLEAVIRFGTRTPWGYVGFFGDNPSPVFYGTTQLIFWLLPAMVFLYGWHVFRRVYRGLSWMFYSLLPAALLTVLLAHITAVDTSVVDASYANLHQQEYVYLDSVLVVARQKYGLVFSAEEEQTLREWSTKDVQVQLEEVQQSFAGMQKVSLKNILIQRISLHNLRPRNHDLHQDWPYAYPQDIGRQLTYFSPQAAETEEMIKMLAELVLLYNTERPKDFSSAYRWQFQRYSFQRNLFRQKYNVDQLKSLVQHINSNSAYDRYHEKLEDLQHH